MTVCECQCVLREWRPRGTQEDPELATEARSSPERLCPLLTLMVVTMWGGQLHHQVRTGPPQGTGPTSTLLRPGDAKLGPEGLEPTPAAVCAPGAGSPAHRSQVSSSPAQVGSKPPEGLAETAAQARVHSPPSTDKPQHCPGQGSTGAGACARRSPGSECRGSRSAPSLPGLAQPTWCPMRTCRSTKRTSRRSSRRLAEPSVSLVRLPLSLPWWPGATGREASQICV